MRNFTSFKSLLVMLLCLVSGSAFAQFATTVEQQVRTDYAPVYATFSLSEVATALQTDTATLDAAIAAWLVTDSAGAYVNDDTKLFGIQDTTIATTAAVGDYYNADGRGSYWLNLDGTLGAWGENAVYNSLIQVDPANDQFIIPLGHYPSTVATANLSFLMQYNGNTVDFAITYVITPLPDAPEAELDLNKVTVVGTAECSTERYSTNGYETTSVAVAASDMAEKLGVTKEDLASYFAQDVYVAKADAEMGFKVDSLQLLTATDGWLLQVAENNEGIAGDLTKECCGAAYDGADAYFIQSMAYDATTDTVTFVMGQMPSKLAVGDSLYTDLYVMAGSKAYVIRHNLYIIEAPYNGLEDMTEVGVQYITIEQYPTTDYSTTAIAPNLDEAAQLLGCTTADLSLKALASNGGFSSQTTANNGGWWFTSAGTVTTWGAGESGSYFFIEPAASGDYSSLNFGQYPSDYAAGDSAVTDLYLVYGNSYYRLHCVMNIVAEPQPDWQTWKNVATRKIVIKQHFSKGIYQWSNYATIADTELQGTLGCDHSSANLVFYAQAKDADVESTGNPYSKNYTCDPHPGFWCDADGKNIGWGSSVWGLTIGNTTLSDGIALQCMFMGSQTVGTSFNGPFYLVNVAEGKMMTLNITFSLVSDDEAETAGGLGDEVGSSDLTVKIPVGGGDESEKEFALDDIATALGYESTDAMAESQCLIGLTATGGSTTAATISEGLGFDANGGAVSPNDGVYGIYFENGNIYVWANDDVAEGFQKTTTVTFLNPDTNKSWTINLTMVNAEDYDTAVKSIVVSNEGAIYDMAGRRVGKAQRGVYIQNGKKILK